MSVRNPLTLRGAVGLGVSLIALSAAGQPGTDPPPRSVTVTAAPLDRASIERQAADFIARTGIAAGQRPAARWEQPVCPRVVGLHDQYGRRVEERMRATAEAAGIRVASEPCEANIVVSFTEDAATTVRIIEARAPRRLAQVAPPERERLTTGRAPIRWWYVTGTQGGNGGPTNFSEQPGVGGVGVDGVDSMVSSVEGGSNQLYNSSLIRTGAARVLLDATVIIDVGLVEGIPLDSVGAFAALVAFAEIRPSEPPPAQSVLGLFQPGAPRITTITAWDAALLRSLYRLPLDRSSRYHRGSLVNGLIASAVGAPD